MDRCEDISLSNNGASTIAHPVDVWSVVERQITLPWPWVPASFSAANDARQRNVRFYGRSAAASCKYIRRKQLLPMGYVCLKHDGRRNVDQLLSNQSNNQWTESVIITVWGTLSETVVRLIVYA